VIPPDNLRDLLLTLMKTQEDCLNSLNIAFADLETIKMALWTLNPDPAFSKRLEEAMKMNRDRYAEELARSRAELALLRSTVSRLVN